MQEARDAGIRRGRSLALLASLATVLAWLAGCGGGSDDADPGPGASGRPLVMWITEDQPDRLRAVRANVARFAARADREVDVVPIGEDELAARIAAAVRSRRPPDVVQLPMASAVTYARDGTLSVEAAERVLARLGEQTFSARALSLVTDRGAVAAVPSDGWGQLLIYRSDVFAGAGLPAPRSLADVRAAVRRLDQLGLPGVVLPTEPSSFTAQTFEHLALASSCELVDDAGRVALDSPACRRAFRDYVELARANAVRGPQGVDSTREAYFSGRASMIFWSPFLLDALAGLRGDERPTCPECADDREFLARHSGLVGPLIDPGGHRAQFGEISTWGITAGGDEVGAERLVGYLLSDGYVAWMAQSPQGKYPVRLGDRRAPRRFVEAWTQLPSGTERRVPLADVYPRSSIESLGDGLRSLRRWGFEHGRAALEGALRADEPVATALAAAVASEITPDRAAERAQAAVEALQRDM